MEEMMGRGKKKSNRETSEGRKKRRGKGRKKIINIPVYMTYKEG